MRNIGFHGGHTIYELGSTSDMILFFECIKVYVVQNHPQQDWSLITDRLYKRYLHLEELNEASKLMNKIIEIFTALPNAAINWEDSKVTPENTMLNSKLPTLADIFSRYFEHFFSAIESAKSFVVAFEIYQPVRIVISDMPAFMLEKKRSLEEYDNLVGEPFWLRKAE